jgi:hypothetical protein
MSYLLPREAAQELFTRFSELVPISSIGISGTFDEPVLIVYTEKNPRLAQKLLPSKFEEYEVKVIKVKPFRPLIV